MTEKLRLTAARLSSPWLKPGALRRALVKKTSSRQLRCLPGLARCPNHDPQPGVSSQSLTTTYFFHYLFVRSQARWLEHNKIIIAWEDEIQKKRVPEY